MRVPSETKTVIPLEEYYRMILLKILISRPIIWCIDNPHTSTAGCKA